MILYPAPPPPGAPVPPGVSIDMYDFLLLGIAIVLSFIIFYKSNTKFK